jgi:hypothetical protein
MITSEWLMSVAAFILGCILTEVRWIFRMRSLQGQLGFRDASRETVSERLHSFASEDAGVESAGAFDTLESLRNLSHELAKNAPVSPIPERLTILRS